MSTHPRECTSMWAPIHVGVHYITLIVRSSWIAWFPRIMVKLFEWGRGARVQHLGKTPPSREKVGGARKGDVTSNPAHIKKCSPMQDPAHIKKCSRTPGYPQPAQAHPIPIHMDTHVDTSHMHTHPYGHPRGHIPHAYPLTWRHPPIDPFRKGTGY